MSKYQLKTQGHNIVLIGNFNPKIFQPAWFAAEKLLKIQEAEAANIEVIHPDVVVFTLDWLKLQVTRERFMVETSQEAFDEFIRDLVLGTFSLLSHTPITKMGLNRSMHFLLQSVKEWHTVGHKLAPKDLWDGILHDPGMRSLIMEESKRRDGLNGYIRATIEPSVKIQPGLFINLNDHFETKDPNSTIGAEEIMSILKASWKESYDRSRGMIYSLVEKLL